MSSVLPCLWHHPSPEFLTLVPRVEILPSPSRGEGNNSSHNPLNFFQLPVGRVQRHAGYLEETPPPVLQKFFICHNFFSFYFISACTNLKSGCLDVFSHSNKTISKHVTFAPHCLIKSTPVLNSYLFLLAEQSFTK